MEGLKIKRMGRAEEERKAYTKADLAKLIKALPSPATSPDKFIIPLIGLFSGMRMGEICVLHLNDVKQVRGVWCFDVNEEGDKRLKTLSSKRIIPIHPHLLKVGLIQHAELLRTNGEVQLWPNLTRRDIDGYCHSFGNWYGRFNAALSTARTVSSSLSRLFCFCDIGTSWEQFAPDHAVVKHMRTS